MIYWYLARRADLILSPDWLLPTPFQCIYCKATLLSLWTLLKKPQCQQVIKIYSAFAHSALKPISYIQNVKSASYTFINGDDDQSSVWICPSYLLYTRSVQRCRLASRADILSDSFTSWSSDSLLHRTKSAKIGGSSLAASIQNKPFFPLSSKSTIKLSEHLLPSFLLYLLIKFATQNCKIIEQEEYLNWIEASEVVVCSLFHRYHLGW